MNEAVVLPVIYVSAIISGYILANVRNSRKIEMLEQKLEEAEEYIDCLKSTIRLVEDKLRSRADFQETLKELINGYDMPHEKTE